MIDPVTMNARKPQETNHGEAMLDRMNLRHQPLYAWGLEHVSLEEKRHILDIGFGGGQHIKNLCGLLPQAHIDGIDYSSASYQKCAALNAAAIAAGQVDLRIGSAEDLPYEAGQFDLVTAFETVYYWPHIETCLRRVHDVLQDGGAFLICNEDSSADGHEEIATALDMQFYGADDLERMLKAAGFRTVHTYERPETHWVCAVAVR